MMPSSTILIIGASGGVAKFILAKLLALSASSSSPLSLRVSSRSPSKTSFPSSVEVVQADLSDPSSFPALFANIDQAFIYRHGAEQTYQKVIDSAKQAGVRHLVFLSSSVVLDFPSSPLGKHYKAIEDAFMASGITYTLLRPGAFSSNVFNYFVPQLKSTGKVRMPYLAAESRPIAPEDIADVAVTALTTTKLDNQTPYLTGPASMSLRDQLVVLDSLSKEAGGKGVHFEEVSPEVYREVVSKSGIPPFVLDGLLAMWKGTEGVKQKVSEEKEEITGLPPVSFESWARKYAVPALVPPSAY